MRTERYASADADKEALAVLLDKLRKNQAATTPHQRATIYKAAWDKLVREVGGEITRFMVATLMTGLVFASPEDLYDMAEFCLKVIREHDAKEKKSRYGKLARDNLDTFVDWVWDTFRAQVKSQYDEYWLGKVEVLEDGTLYNPLSNKTWSTVYNGWTEEVEGRTMVALTDYPLPRQAAG